MKKLLFFPVCVLLAFSSCKKDSDKKATASNTITASVGGSNLNFNTGAIAELESSSGEYAIEIGGSTTTGSSGQAVSIVVESESPIVTGTYTLNSMTNTIATSFPKIQYIENQSSSNLISYETDVTGAYSSTVTITAISSTNVQGTFNGVLISGQNSTDTKTISNGKFNVNISPTKVQ